MYKNYLLCCGAAALLFGAVAGAQEADLADANLRLEPIEVAGLRPVEVDDLTGSVTVLSAEDLAMRHAPYLADQLRAVPGVAVSRSGAVGGLTQIRMRGAEANHTLVLLDGIEVSDPVTGETDFGLLSGLNPKRINVLRGEQSALYGSDAIGGIVAIKTGDVNGLRGAAEFGSLDTERGQLGFGLETGSGHIGGALSVFQTNGVDTSGLGGEADGSQSHSGLINGQTDLGQGWTLSGLATYRDSEVETDPDLNFDGALDNADRVSEAGQWLTGFALSGKAGAVDHLFRGSFNSVTRDNLADGQTTDTTIGQRAKLSYSPSVDWRGGGAEHRLSGLIDYEFEDYTRRGQASFFGDPNQSRGFRSYGLAAEYRLDLGALDLNASARHDLNNDRFDDADTWRLGAAYAFDFDARIRASVGTGIKNPTFTELFGFFPGSFVGNPNLTPETSTGWEIGWDQDFGALQIAATYFSAELEDEIYTAFNPDFTSTARNRTDKSERRGIELGAKWRASDTLNINASATLTTSENDSGEDEIRVPNATASFGFDWRSPNTDGLRVGGALDYVGEQDDFNFGTFPAARVTLDSYILASLTAEYPLSQRISLTLRGENLFDEPAIDVLGFHAPGAGVFVGLKLR